MKNMINVFLRRSGVFTCEVAAPFGTLRFDSGGREMKHQIAAVIACAMGLFLAATSLSQADTTSFQEGVAPTGVYAQDAVYIRDSQPTTNNDGSDQVLIGTTSNPHILRGLFEFDISDVSASDQIDSVSLDLTTHSSAGLDGGGETGNPTFNVYAYGFDIVETVSTWNDPDGDGVDGTPDATNGGTLGTLLSSVSFDPTQTGLGVTFVDTAAFRTAVANALAADGILRLIIAKNDESTTDHEFTRIAAESFATSASRPELVITHTAPAPTGSVTWAAPGVSNIAATTADAYATLGGTNAEVALYWKQGSSAPQQHTGWEGTNALPAGNIATGLVERAMTGLDSDTLYSFIFYGTNSSNQIEAWSGAGNVTTALSSEQAPVFTNAFAGKGFVTLGWNDSATHETAYLLQRSASGSGGPYSVIDTLIPDTVSYLDAGLSVGTYHYRLAATNAANGSVTDFTACQTNATVNTVPAWIYLEMFSGSGDLNGADPDIRPGSETWTASLWQQDGTIADLNERADSAWLPFTPQSGRVYSLAATVDAVASGGTRDASWTALGFGNASDTTTFFEPPNNTAPWVLYRATGTPDQIVTWTGPGVTGTESEGTVAGPVTLSIVLDTTSANWTAEWFEGSNSLRTHTYSSNPTITTVGFGRSIYSNGPITTFSLVDSSTPAGTMIFVK